MISAMQLGISSFTYGWGIGTDAERPARPLNEVDLVQRSIDLDVQCLQIGDNLPLHALPQERLTNLRHLIKTHRIRLEVGSKRLTSENLERYIELASFFESPLIRFVVDDAGYEPSLREIFSILKYFSKELEQRDIYLGIENHDRFRSKEFARMVEAGQSDHIGICLDSANSLGAGEGLEHVVSVLGQYTINVHIKDVMVERLPHKMGFTVRGTPAGEGIINIPWLLEKVSGFGRCQSAILEQWVKPLPSLEETIENERQSAADSIRYLKAIFHKTKSVL